MSHGHITSGLAKYPAGAADRCNKVAESLPLKNVKDVMAKVRERARARERRSKGGGERESVSESVRECESEGESTREKERVGESGRERARDRAKERL